MLASHPAFSLHSRLQRSSFHRCVGLAECLQVVTVAPHRRWRGKDGRLNRQASDPVNSVPLPGLYAMWSPALDPAVYCVKPGYLQRFIITCNAEISLRGPAATKTGTSKMLGGIAQRKRLNEAALRGRGREFMGIDSAG
jgi:hypothetical protein